MGSDETCWNPTNRRNWNLNNRLESWSNGKEDFVGCFLLFSHGRDDRWIPAGFFRHSPSFTPRSRCLQVSPGVSRCLQVSPTGLQLDSWRFFDSLLSSFLGSYWMIPGEEDRCVGGRVGRDAPKHPSIPQQLPGPLCRDSLRGNPTLM